MKDELNNHGEAALNTDKTTFLDLIDKYKTAHIFPAVIRNGRKVAELKSARTENIHLNKLADFFGKKKIRSIKPIDIENFKTERLNTSTIHGKELPLLLLTENLPHSGLS